MKVIHTQLLSRRLCIFPLSIVSLQTSSLFCMSNVWWYSETHKGREEEEEDGVSRQRRSS